MDALEKKCLNKEPPPSGVVDVLYYIADQRKATAKLASAYNAAIIEALMSARRELGEPPLQAQLQQAFDAHEQRRCNILSVESSLSEAALARSARANSACGLATTPPAQTRQQLPRDTCLRMGEASGPPPGWVMSPDPEGGYIRVSSMQSTVSSMQSAEQLTSPPRWKPPPRAEGEELSLLERHVCEQKSGLNTCRSALKELDARARDLVAETSDDSPNRENADFVRDPAERFLLDQLMCVRTPAKIMIMGEMNSGKSLLLNTLLRFGEGNKKNPGLLPSTNKPCTKRITVLKYARSPTVELHAGWSCDPDHVAALTRAWTEHLHGGGSLHGLVAREGPEDESPDEPPPPPESVLQVDM
jgi:hypothetical protein